MTAKSLVWALRVGAMVAAAVAAGCGGTFIATDGSAFRCESITKGSFYSCHGTEPDPISSALTSSGAHDLPCAIDQVRVAHLSGEEYAASGCGWRAVYRVGDDLRVVLLSRSPVTPGGDDVPPQAGIPSAQ